MAGGGRPQRGSVAGPALALILSAVYTVEGGFTNNPADPGGATNYGVTERVARAHGYRGDMRYFPKHCDGPADACADAVYVADYIERPGYMPLVDEQPAVADKLINTAVNMGPPRPNRWFREALGMAPQGLPLMPSDITAFQRYEAMLGGANACETMLRALSAKQEAEYLRLIANSPRLGTFRKGWLARARNLHPGGIPCKETDNADH